MAVDTVVDRRSYANPDRSPPASIDGDALERDLRAAVKGAVRFSRGDRALYATDASNYRQVPIGVVEPVDAEDVERAVEVCRRHGAPITCRGGGTSLAGQACNVAVVLDFTRHMNRIVAVDAKRRIATVEPGCVLDDLQRRIAPLGLMVGPDPSTHDRCTLGGMVGNNSCGTHSQLAGRTDENVVALDVLTYDGARFRVAATGRRELKEILRLGGRRGEIHRRLAELRAKHAKRLRAMATIPRRVSGYNLDALLPKNSFDVARALVGTEGTCAIVLAVTVRLLPRPRERILVVAGFPDVYRAADAVPRIAKRGPIALEGIDDRLVEFCRRKGRDVGFLETLPPGKGWLLIEFGADSKEKALAKARRLVRDLPRLGGTGAVVADPEGQHRFWRIRESGLGVTSWVPGFPDTWEGWEDSAVAPERLGRYLRDLRALYERHGVDGAFYGHFGQGCVHTRITFDLASADGVARFRTFVEEAADLVVSHGGSLSGEHGDGQARAELLPRMYGPDLIQAFREFKAIWDPLNRMNPGKVVDPYAVTDNLRLGAEYAPAEPKVHFHYEADGGRFSRAALRCVGVGLCRRTQSGLMCPSYMVTKDEQHSTRGRARLLFEMLQGDVIRGWRSKAVRESLDLCLACKGCRSECPVNVDMATYKAEFLSHHYAWRLRPRSAYALGLIHRWARVLSKMPRLANWSVNAPGLGGAAKWAAGIDRRRDVPAFATTTFRRWFGKRNAPAGSGRPRVLLWPDTFTNHFEPHVGRAAVEALEHAGYRVEIPKRVLCCGRPLYDYGMLRQAKRLLRRTVKALRDDIDAGTPLVGLEPSCVATFRDEMTNLLDDGRAEKLRGQTFTLAEFFERNPPRVSRLDRKALVQRHCHHQSVMGFDADERLLRRLGLDVEVLDSGCCGLAGSFGFEKRHYDVSMACGERVLFPAVRNADENTLLLADGFSCRTQLEHATGRRALHLAEVIRMAQR